MEWEESYDEGGQRSGLAICAALTRIQPGVRSEIAPDKADVDEGLHYASEISATTKSLNLTLPNGAMRP